VSQTKLQGRHRYEGDSAQLHRAGSPLPHYLSYNHFRGVAVKRNWNWLIWAGFATALFAVFSYIPLFVPFPITRDFPWVNLLLFLAAGCLMAAGLYRAFARPDKYRGKVSGPVLGAISLGLFGLFYFGTFYIARHLPSGLNALRVGQQAPDFALADTEGRMVTLSQLRQGKRAALLIFYRGYW
jgi:hypothetical protein